MVDLVRREVITQATTVVVKVGTRVLTDATGRLDGGQIERLVAGIETWRRADRQVILVSSGAVGAGMSLIGLRRRPTDLAQLQALAAIGQAKLIETYDRTLQKYGRHAAQVLLTADVFNHRSQYLNVRNTLLSLLDMGVVPVVNENDTVAVDELQTTFGDNDRLAAHVTNLVQAPLLIILSDVAGVYDGPPDHPDSHVIETVTQIDERLRGFVHQEHTSLSKGGMASKLEAARIATTAGGNVIVAGGRETDILQRLLAEDACGTLFLAQGKRVSPWKRWITAVQTRGTIEVDSGACNAIVNDGRSLLAIGIKRTAGDYEKGDVVSIVDPNQREVARGLSNYSAADVEQVRGLPSAKILEVLGHQPYQEVVHRSNLAVTDASGRYQT